VVAREMAQLGKGDSVVTLASVSAEPRIMLKSLADLRAFGEAEEREPHSPSPDIYVR
jgi:hypothetical protein